MKILVVEDEAPIRDLISINLQLVGYEVFTAEDGIVAENFLEKQKVDLILLDVMIPGIDVYGHIGGLIGGIVLSYTLGLPNKRKTKEIVNGLIITLILIAALSYMLIIK